MALNGYIKLHRQLLDWEWYKDTNTKIVFLHLMLCANFKDGNWRGQAVKRGQFITTYKTLSADLGLSLQQIRTTFEKMKSTNDITWIPTGKNILVTVVKFDVYQSNEQDEQHDEQHDSNNKTTTKQQQRNNEKKDKNDKNKTLKAFLLIENEEKYPSNFNNDLIDSFENFLHSRNNLRKPIKDIDARIKALSKQIDKFGSDSVLDAIKNSIDNQYQGIFPKANAAFKNPKQEEQPQDLETYLLQYFRPIDIEHLKKGGNFQRYEQQLSENLFKLTNVAKFYKNQSITPLFLFELLYTPLGNRLNGSTPERKLDSFERFFKKQNDYNQNQGDMRQLVKDLAQTQ